MSLRITGKTAFTFIEVMVTITILSVGILMIFKSYINMLDQMRHINNRLYANVIIENRVSEIERMLRVYNILPFELDHVEHVDVGHRVIAFKQVMHIDEVEDFPDVFQLDLALTWQEGRKDIILSRSAYILDFNYIAAD